MVEGVQQGPVLVGTFFSTIGFCSGMCFQKHFRSSFDGFRCCRFAFAWIRPSFFHSSVVQISSQSVAE